MSVSGSRTPQGSGSMSAGLLYQQGSVGAALVAEALRQELAEQLAAATTSARGGLPPRGRSRSLSPLPTRRSTDGSRAASPLPRQGSGQQGQQAAGSSPAGTAGLELPPSLLLFPGLPRAGSGPVSGGGSGSSTPRLRAALPPPPPRRSTHVSQRVLEQVGPGG